jgi:hypothetical protein
MMTSTVETSPLVHARVAGLLYLLANLPAPFSLIYIPHTLIVPGNATTTANNVVASESLLRLGIGLELFTAAAFLFAVFALYRLLQVVNKQYALLMVILFAVSTPISFLNVLNEIAALILIRGADFLSVFDKGQLDALAMVFFNLHSNGTVVAGMFWGLWLFPFGLLVLRSGFLPRVLGVMLFIACFGYLLNCVARILFPGYVDIVAPLATALYFGEIPIVLWLLIMGVNVEQWKKRALEPA